MFDGVGEIINPDGTEYKGTFKSGQFDGHGQYKFATGEVYDGGFKMGQLVGNGTITTKDGIVKKCVCEKGLVKIVE